MTKAKKTQAALGVQVGQRWRREDDRVARVMAVADGYAMVRFLACMPFVEAVKAIERNWVRFD